MFDYNRGLALIRTADFPFFGFRHKIFYCVLAIITDVVWGLFFSTYFANPLYDKNKISAKHKYWVEKCVWEWDRAKERWETKIKTKRFSFLRKVIEEVDYYFVNQFAKFTLLSKYFCRSFFPFPFVEIERLIFWKSNSISVCLYVHLCVGVGFGIW